MNFFFTFSLLLVFCSSLYSQVDTTQSPLLVITLLDNTEYVGRITSSELKFLNFTTRENMVVGISKDRIKEIVCFEDSRLDKKEKYALKMKETGADKIVVPVYTDANLNRMVIFPTARPMKPWQMYVQLNELFLPFAAVGIGDFLTIGGGISLIPDAGEQMVYFSPKITPLHSQSLSLAAGVFYLTSTHFNNDDFGFPEGLGVVYTMATIGDYDKSLTAGLGWGFSGEHFTNKPIVILGGDIKIGRNLKLIVETWSPSNTGYIMGMLGFRIIGKHMSGDAAIIRPFGRYTKDAILPWFNFTYNFGYE